MTRLALLNKVEHRDLRVVTTRSAALGDEVMYAMTFPAEFRNLQAYYPIVFARSASGEFTPLALFGFREKQNLFLTSGGWDAAYLPLLIDRQPFLIGTTGTAKMIHIDLDHPRVSRTEGELLFLDNGGNTGYLDHVNSVLAAIDEGVAATQPFIKALTEYNLLESFVLDIEFRDGVQHRFAGFYTVQEERLNALGGEALGKLHERGYLQAIYMVIASMSNFRGLIERVNRLTAVSR